MKACLNIHCHQIDIYEFERGIFKKKCTLKSNFQEKIDTQKIYAITCSGNEFINEFNSNFSINNLLPASLFSSKNNRKLNNYNFGNLNYYYFIEFKEFILLGTKDEIISYIIEKYNIKDEENENLEKKINEVKYFKKDYEKEKNKNEKIKNDYNKVDKENKSLLNDLEKEKIKNEKMQKDYNNLTKERNELINDKTKIKIEMQNQIDKLSKEKEELLKVQGKEKEKEKIKNEKALNDLKNLLKEKDELLNKEKIKNENGLNDLKKMLKEKDELLNKEKIKNENSLNDLKKFLKEKDELLNKEKINNEKALNSLNLIKKEKDELLKQFKKQKETISEFELNLNDLKSKHQSLIEKEKEIKTEIEKKKNLNKNLEAKISELENQKNQLNDKNKNLEISIKQKEDIITEAKNSLIKEQNINRSLSESLNLEKGKNKELKNKLDNIASENNENMKKILQRLQNEEETNKNIKPKYSELEKSVVLLQKQNEELQSQLKIKNEKLEMSEKNEYSSLKFQLDCKKGEYDITLDITNFSNLIREGWVIRYNSQEGKQKYLKKKEEDTVVVGVVGNRNKGKSFILALLSGYDIDSGFNTKTVGLSIRYGTSPQHNIAILDSAGQESPLLKEENKNLSEDDSKTENEKCYSKTEETTEELSKDENSSKIEESEESEQNQETPKGNINKNNKNGIDEESEETKSIEFEKHSRDKLITEYFIQKFILWKSDIILLVVGNITFTEQKLLYNVKNAVKSLNTGKQIFVIHNLKELTKEEDVNDYIDNTLKKLFNIEIKKIPFLQLLDEKNTNYFPYYFVEKNEKVSHFIFINAFTEKSNYYNIPVIKHIQKAIELNITRNKFSIIDDCKQFLIDNSEDIMEEVPTSENLVLLEDEKCDRIVLKNFKDINLKSFAIDETGGYYKNDNDDPKYSHYIENNKLSINIELPGGGKLIKNVVVGEKNYYFIFKGKKNGDKKIEEDKKNEVSKLLCKKNQRKNNNFFLKIPIPSQLIQVVVPKGETLGDQGKLADIENDEKNEGRKGVYSFEYDVILVNQKVEVDERNTLDL